jgi:hypothetical protein
VIESQHAYSVIKALAAINEAIWKTIAPADRTAMPPLPVGKWVSSLLERQLLNGKPPALHRRCGY